MITDKINGHLRSLLKVEETSQILNFRCSTFSKTRTALNKTHCLKDISAIVN